MVDPDDVALTGQVTSATLMALGLPQYDQASRILKFNLDKSIRGNTYVEFQSSVKAIGVAPGDIITVTYLKEGFTRQPFRVLKISPATNYRTATISAQIHDDAWYADTNGQCLSPSGATIQDTSGVGLPKPLLGSVVDVDGNVQFGVAETATANSDGSVETSILVSFVPPAVLAVGGPAVPLIDLSPTYGTGGTFQSGQVLYYAVLSGPCWQREHVIVPGDSKHRGGWMQRHSYGPELCFRHDRVPRLSRKHAGTTAPDCVRPADRLQLYGSRAGHGIDASGGPEF